MDIKGSFIPRQVRVIEKGKVEVEHTSKLKGVTAEMLNWFYQLVNSPENFNTERYRLWHPDHIEWKFLYKRGEEVIGHRATERFGKRAYKIYVYMGKETGNGKTEGGWAKIPLINWLNFPAFTVKRQIANEFTPELCISHQTQILGSDNPIWGRFSNFFLRKFVLPHFLKGLFQHEDEEAMIMEKLLPKVYAEDTAKKD